MTSPQLEPTAATRPPLAVAITFGFLGIIYLLPALQLASELASLQDTWPTALRLIPAFQRALMSPVAQPASVYSRIVTANQNLCGEFQDYEQHVTLSAWPVARPREWLQGVLTGPLRSGNEQVVVGNAGWLFFRPDVEALTGPGFLEPPVVRPGVTGARRQSNPLPAIRRFAEDLRKRGVDLLILPIPSKGTLLARTAKTGAPHNASYRQFLNELRHSGIKVCDSSAILLDSGRDENYLRTDSHWNPEGVRLTADMVAKQLKREGLIVDSQPQRYLIKTMPLENIGDTARLLGKDASRQVVAPERCEITQVKNADQSDWTPDPHADILLLGDSFSNIYSQPELGWGTSAGFAEQLSHILNRPLDRIALNAGGALASRQELVRQLSSGNDRLANKKLVVWQFAERELSFGDWQLLPLPDRSGAPTVRPVESAAIIIQGVITQAGQLPNPASLPYREALLPLHLKSVKAEGQTAMPADVVVYVWGMQNRRLTSAAEWKAGQRVRLKLIPWSEAEREFGRFARAELDDPDLTLIDLPTYWGEPAP